MNRFSTLFLTVPKWLLGIFKGAAATKRFLLVIFPLIIKGIIESIQTRSPEPLITSVGSYIVGAEDVIVSNIGILKMQHTVVQGLSAWGMIIYELVIIYFFLKIIYSFWNGLNNTQPIINWTLTFLTYLLFQVLYGYMTIGEFLLPGRGLLAATQHFFGFGQEVLDFFKGFTSEPVVVSS